MSESESTSIMRMSFFGAMAAREMVAVVIGRGREQAPGFFQFESFRRHATRRGLWLTFITPVLPPHAFLRPPSGSCSDYSRICSRRYWDSVELLSSLQTGQAMVHTS